MFPSCGYFSSFPCPFFVNGLCERPYCHFRHSKHDIEKHKEDLPLLNYSGDDTNYLTASTSSTSVRSSSPVDSTLTSASQSQKPDSDSIGPEEAYFTSDPLEKSLPPPSPTLSQEVDAGSFSIPSFTDNSSKYQVPIAEEPEQYHTASPEKSWEQGGSNSQYPLIDAGPPALPTYLPTPKTPSLPAPQPVKDFDVPVYQPTPKRELKRRHGDHAKGKAKGTDLEYDPECNYSCGGLTNSTQNQPKEEGDALNYKPTKKKPRGADPINNRKMRLSCESLIAGSPDVARESEDEDMPDGEFSEEENDSELGPSSMEEGSVEEEGMSEDFEKIGDEDISSDDDFVDVPNLALSEFDIKNLKDSLPKLGDKGSKSPGLVVEKSKLSSDGAKQEIVRPEKTNIDAVKKEQRRTSKDSTSKSSSSVSKPKSSSSSNSSKTDKSSRSSSRKGTTSSSSSAKLVKQDSKKSSSGSAKGVKVSSSKAHGSHSSKTDEEKVKNKNGSISKSTSSEKSLSNKSSSSSSKHSSLPKKQASSETKSSSSSCKHSSSSSDVKRKSSLGDKTASDNRCSSDSKGEKRSSTSTKNSSFVKLSNSDSKSTRTSGKHSSSDSKSTKSVAKHSDSDRRASLSGKHSSSDSKRTDTGHHSHNKSPASSKKDLSIKSQSKKDGSSHSSSKNQNCERIATEKSSGKPALHRRNSSSTKHSDKEKTQKADSSLHHKGKESARRKLSMEKKDKSEILVRMNSSLFGDDSDDEDTGENAMKTSDFNVGESSICDPSTSRAGEEDKFVDYSSYINDSDFEEEDVFDECLRIFKEELPHKKGIGQQEKKLVKDLKADGCADDGARDSIPGKKRTAHKAAEQIRKLELQKKKRPRRVLNPAEVMHNRITEMRRKALEQAEKQAVQEQEVSSTSGFLSSSKLPGLSLGLGGGKKRVAHLPKPASATVASKTKASSAKGENKSTHVTTASKTEKRVAHTPNLANLKRPVIPANFGSKVPSNIRQRYLNLIIDECLKFCPTEEQAYKKGLEEETGVYERASNKNIYLRVAVNTITRLRSEAKEAVPGSSKSQPGHPSVTQSHQATLGGSRAAKTSFTLHRSTGSGKKVEVVLTQAELYQKLAKYLMTEEQLEENGYPRFSPDTPSKAVIKGTRYQETDALLKDNERTCSRCGKRFIVNSDGSYVNSEECVYHWTRAYPRKKSGFIQHIYNCCSSDTSSKGCQVASNHVHDQNKHNSLGGFMRTMPRSPPRDGNFGIYALDCEMVYTLGGLELARVTVVNTEGESVFESLVQPFNPIVDYNTRFSGLKEADLTDVETTLTDVQAVLLNLFSDKTILIGHSLESDLIALKLIHSTVVDTSVVFPHRLGPPYKRALKNLMLETFQKIIQCDDGGHDSKEDAVACLQLMKWRIKEDSKREQRYS